MSKEHSPAEYFMIINVQEENVMNSSIKNRLVQAWYVLRGKSVIANIDIKFGKGTEWYVPYERDDVRLRHCGLVSNLVGNESEIKIVTPAERQTFAESAPRTRNNQSMVKIKKKGYRLKR